MHLNAFDNVPTTYTVLEDTIIIVFKLITKGSTISLM